MPVGGMYSPAELLMSRRLRSTLPCTDKQLKSKTVNNFKYNKFIKDRQNSYKKYYNEKKGVKSLKPLNIGQNAFVQLKPKGNWLPAKIIERVRDRTYKVRMENGSLLKDLRNLKEEGESSHKKVYISLENKSQEVGQELENINSDKVEESDEETRSDSVISEKDKSSNLRDGKIINLDFGENSNNVAIEIDHNINHETDTSSEDNSLVYETDTSHLVSSYGRKIKCPQRLDL
uniref:Uncharacterized protein LOC114348911 n=1 Tax=Diabrotica virgifera virgifera TaxID=50390 RepID=A0A6P7H952_DIAVI